MKKLLILLSLAAYSQVTVTAPNIQLDVNGAAAVRSWMLTQTKSGATKLASPAASNATTLTFESGAGFGVGTVAIIGTEMVDITSKAGAVMTVTRGLNGTTPAAYLTGDAVLEAKYKTFNNLMKQIAVDAFKGIVSQSVTITGPVTSAQAAATATVETAVQ